MYEVTIETAFSGAHLLRGYAGKCGGLHGHNWKVVVTAASDRLDEVGMALDFASLKEQTREVLAQVDHTYLNEVFPFTEINPTAENIARWVCEMLTKHVADERIVIRRVMVWESDNAAATYIPHKDSLSIAASLADGSANKKA
ncbi:MAG: 6-carboxytetrahydropterin synthase QueD [Nitrospirota bacterium]|nr:6-carboxytetrahydropterin synthase QueD [Nitrospirota bacterium]